MAQWESIGIGVEGEPFYIKCVNIWSEKWLSINEPPVELPHPSYPWQRHKMWTYEIEIKNEKVRFTAGELVQI